MKKNIEIISLVYKSIDYTYLIYKQLKSEFNTVEGWDVDVRLILNDATEEIINEVKKLDIKHTIYNDENISDFWTNRMYRCYNYAAITSEYDNICFVNSDMIFSKDWLKNLIKHHNGKNLPCSRLVESGKLSSGTHGISMNFGKNPNDIDYIGFFNYVKLIAVDEIHNGGLYMPCVFNKQQFFDLGMYPEQANIIDQGADRYWFNLLSQQNKLQQITVFDSIVYHIQTGERDEKL